MPAGFSTRTCLPFFTAASATGASAKLIVAIITTSTFGELTACSNDSVTMQPELCAAIFFARSSCVSHATVTLPGASRFNRFCPMRPQPMRATRKFISIPFLAAIFGHDAAQAVDIRLRQFVAIFLQILPRIPLRADELAGDAVALRAGEINRKTGTEFERHRAFFLPSFVLLEKRRTDFFGASGENFIHEPRRQSAGRNGVHVHLKTFQ